jgi:tRNA(adenine34) deaminase
MDYNYFMRIALEEARKAKEKEEVPIGAVVVFNEEVISKAHNQILKENSQLKHAELIAIEKAAKALGDWRLDNCDIYVTVEPCIMCMGAIILSRFKRLIYGVANNITGAFSGTNKIRKEKLKLEVISGILEYEALSLMKDFFFEIRKE